MSKLFAVAAVLVGSVGGVGQRSDADTEWQTVASAKVVVPSGRWPAGGGFANVGSLARNPERLRIVYDGSRSPDSSMFVSWYMECSRKRPFRSIDRGRNLSPTKLPLTVRLTDRVPGGVGAWDVCFLQTSVHLSARGELEILVQARYP
jgi:hypothetical protein